MNWMLAHIQLCLTDKQWQVIGIIFLIRKKDNVVLFLRLRTNTARDICSKYFMVR